MRSVREKPARNRQSSCFDCVRDAKSLFCGLPEAALRNLDGVKSTGTYSRGQILFQAGNRPMGIHCIEEGLIKLYRIGPSGKEQIIRLAVPGDMLGYRAMLGEAPHDQYAQAVTDVRVCFIPIESIRFLLRGTPPLMRNMARNLSSEISGIEDRLLQRSQHKAEDRLIGFLLRCAEGMRPANGRIEIPLSRQEIADFIGAAPETVIRALGRLQRRKLISVHGRHLDIPNPEKLAAHLQSSIW